jgi:hypothetical protein
VCPCGLSSGDPLPTPSDSVEWLTWRAAGDSSFDAWNPRVTYCIVAPESRFLGSEALCSLTGWCWCSCDESPLPMHCTVECCKIWRQLRIRQTAEHIGYSLGLGPRLV